MMRATSSGGFRRRDEQLGRFGPGLPYFIDPLPLLWIMPRAYRLRWLIIGIPPRIDLPKSLNCRKRERLLRGSRDNVEAAIGAIQHGFQACDHLDRGNTSRLPRFCPASRCGTRRPSEHSTTVCASPPAPCPLPRRFARPSWCFRRNSRKYNDQQDQTWPVKRRASSAPICVIAARGWTRLRSGSVDLTLVSAPQLGCERDGRLAYR
jgi:hypothetical protein